MIIILFSSVYNQLKLRVVFVFLLLYKEPFVSTEGEGRSSPEWTNQTMAIERTNLLLMFLPSVGCNL